MLLVFVVILLVYFVEIDVVMFQVLGVSVLLKIVYFCDRDGEGLLVLDWIDSQVFDVDSGEVMDVVLLIVMFYWCVYIVMLFVECWCSEYCIECLGFDLEVVYFFDNVEVIDFDGDGVVELILFSYVFCGGGVDLYQIVIEL